MRWMRAGAAMVFGAAWAWAAGGSGCTLREERRTQTLTAEFAAAGGWVRLTVPARLTAEGAKAYLEVAGGDFAATWLESGGERVAVKNGAALHILPKAGERRTFSLTGADGETLCAWRPYLRLWDRRLPPRPDGFTALAWAPSRMPKHFYNLRAPVVLGVGGKLAEETATFRVDGEPATVLARTSREVILRIPQSTPGLRVVESLGYSVQLAVVDMQLEVPAPDVHGRGDLVVTVRGLGEDVRPARWPVYVFLYNLSGERITLLSGKLYRHEADWGPARLIPLTGDGKGTFTGSCKAAFRGKGEVAIDLMLFAMPERTLVPPLRLGKSGR